MKVERITVPLPYIGERTSDRINLDHKKTYLSEAVSFENERKDRQQNQQRDRTENPEELAKELAQSLRSAANPPPASDVSLDVVA